MWTGVWVCGERGKAFPTWVIQLISSSLSVRLMIIKHKTQKSVKSKKCWNTKHLEMFWEFSASIKTSRSSSLSFLSSAHILMHFIEFMISSWFTRISIFMNQRNDDEKILWLKIASDDSCGEMRCIREVAHQLGASSFCAIAEIRFSMSRTQITCWILPHAHQVQWRISSRKFSLNSLCARCAFKARTPLKFPFKHFETPDDSSTASCKVTSIHKTSSDVVCKEIRSLRKMFDRKKFAWWTTHRKVLRGETLVEFWIRWSITRQLQVLCLHWTGFCVMYEMIVKGEVNPRIISWITSTVCVCVEITGRMESGDEFLFEVDHLVDESKRKKFSE